MVAKKIYDSSDCQSLKLCAYVLVLHDSVNMQSKTSLDFFFSDMHTSFMISLNVSIRRIPSI